MIHASRGRNLIATPDAKGAGARAGHTGLDTAGCAGRLAATVRCDSAGSTDFFRFRVMISLSFSVSDNHLRNLSFCSLSRWTDDLLRD